MTIREAYKQMREYFSQPDAVLAKENGFCYYRMDGRKCAVGCLIPDDQYNVDMEGSGLYTLIEEGELSFLGIDPFDGDVSDDPLAVFLAEAQRLHDSMAVDAADFVRLLDEEYAADGGW